MVPDTSRRLAAAISDLESCMVRDLLGLRIFSNQATSRIDMNAHTFWQNGLSSDSKGTDAYSTAMSALEYAKAQSSSSWIGHLRLIHHLAIFFPLYTHAPTLFIFLRRSGGWIKKNCFNSTQSLVCTGCNDACSTGEAFILVITTLDCCCPSADMVHPPPMQVKFLGTCTSPLLTRNYSRFVNVESASWFGYANAIIEVCLLNGTTKRWWCEYRTNGIRMKILTFSDCGEGTQRQLLLPHVNSHTKLAQIRTILITHLHPDRVYHDYLANIQTY